MTSTASANKNVININYGFKVGVDVCEDIRCKKKVNIGSTADLTIDTIRTNPANNNKIFDAGRIFDKIEVLNEYFSYTSNTEGGLFEANVIYKLPDKHPFVPADYIKFAIPTKEKPDEPPCIRKQALIELFEYILMANLNEYYNDPEPLKQAANRRQIEGMLQKCISEKKALQQCLRNKRNLDKDADMLFSYQVCV